MAMKIKEPSMLFEERVGVCNVTLCLDKRNPDRAVDGQFPLCMRFTINYRKYYFCIGEKCSVAELARISKANGHGERKMDNETNFERQVRLQQLFQNYVHVVETLNQTGALTLDRIKTALTGRCESTSLISVWEGIIQEKIQAGKAGTAGSYNNALNCFKNLTGFTYKDGFSIDPTLVNNWVVSMGEHNYAAATQGIYLRACRVVVNRCIAEGHIMQKAYMFGKSRDKIKIPNGASRKGWYLTVEQMKELYNHWKTNDLDFPIYDYKRTDNPPYAVKTPLAAKLIHQSLAMFLMQYLSCGCNLVDLALMRYNRFYFDSDRKAFQFIRHKSEDETKDGEGMEVIVPIIEPMREILDMYGTEPKLDALVFPFLLGDVMDADVMTKRDRMHQENKNVAHRMKKVAQRLGWTVYPSGTYARHSFATNLHAVKVPMEYLSDAMGHSVGNTGQITMRYISPYTIEERVRYNNFLLGINEPEKVMIQSTSATKQRLYEKMDEFSEEEIKDALIMMKKKQFERWQSELMV